MNSTLNGPSVFLSGAFSVNYVAAGYVIGASATGGIGDAEWSIFSGVNATSNANFVANTVSTAVNPSTMTWVNVSSDPTGKGPGSTLYLPGTAQLNVPTAPYGALTAGTWFSGRIIGLWNNTATPTFQMRMHLRSPVTGKVVYTIIDTTAYTTITNNGLGFKAQPSFVVVSGGTAGKIIGTMDINYGISGYQAAPVTTTVDCTQSYILDISAKFGTASASNGLTIYSAEIELVG
jgi:hypothetical protein